MELPFPLKHALSTSFYSLLLCLDGWNAVESEVVDL
jgi:DUF1365 family protein